MSETRRGLLGASLLSAFGLMSASSVVRAAAATSDDQGETGIPIYAKTLAGGAVLLVPESDHKIRAYDVVPRDGARLPEPPFDTNELIRNSRFRLVAIESRVVRVRGMRLHISGGFLLNSLASLDVTPMKWGEIHPPHRHPHRPHD